MVTFFLQCEMVLAEGSIEAVISELSDGDQCSILKSRENVGAAGCKVDMGEREQCGMCCLHIGAIGQADEDAIFCGGFFDAGSVEIFHFMCYVLIHAQNACNIQCGPCMVCIMHDFII